MSQVQLNPTYLTAETLAASAQLLEQLPEAERNSSFGKILNHIVTGGLLGGAFWAKWHSYDHFFKAKEALDGMCNVIDMGDNNQRFIDAMKHHENNSMIIGNIDYMKHLGCCGEKLKDKVDKCQDSLSLETGFKNAINHAKTQMADNVIITSTKMSSVLIVIQIVKLYFVWNEISKAKNLHNDPTKLQSIDQNMQNFKQICDELVGEMTTGDVRRIQRIVRRATVKYNKTKSLISDLRVKINGSTQRLELYADMQVLDGISNFASTIGHFVQLRGVFDSLSSPIALAGGAVVGAFALITIGNGVTYHITQKRLDELRQDCQQLTVYENQLDQLYDIIENAENWLENNQ